MFLQVSDIPVPAFTGGQVSDIPVPAFTGGQVRGRDRF